jgi:hypothetical protein
MEAEVLNGAFAILLYVCVTLNIRASKLPEVDKAQGLPLNTPAARKLFLAKFFPI